MENKKKSFLSKYLSDILFLIAIVMIAFIFSNNYAVLLVQGDSMYPTYNDKDILLLKKDKEFINDNIVVFKSPESWSAKSKKFIKRIVASEGDTLVITNEELIVNGEVVALVSEKKCGLKESVELKIDENKYFVVGDNYSSSNDSLTQFCNQNKEFLVDEDRLMLNGKEKFVGGF